MSFGSQHDNLEAQADFQNIGAEYLSRIFRCCCSEPRGLHVVHRHWEDSRRRWQHAQSNASALPKPTVFSLGYIAFQASGPHMVRWIPAEHRLPGPCSFAQLEVALHVDMVAHGFTLPLLACERACCVKFGSLPASGFHAETVSESSLARLFKGEQARSDAAFAVWLCRIADDFSLPWPACGGGLSGQGSLHGNAV